MRQCSLLFALVLVPALWGQSLGDMRDLSEAYAKARSLAQSYRGNARTWNEPTWTPSPSAGPWKGSVSIGVATLGPGAEDAEVLIKAADVALYEAKRRGRNRVVVFGEAGT